MKRTSRYVLLKVQTYSYDAESHTPDKKVIQNERSGPTKTYFW